MTPPSVCAEAEPRPPLKLAVVAPKPAPTLPSAKSVLCGAGGGVAEIAIGRKASPGLVAAVQEIEADRAGHDRNHRVADAQAAALFGKPGLHAAGGIQSKRGAAGERDARRSASTVPSGSSSALLAGAGAAAADVDRGNRGGIENDRGDAGGERGVVGVADADACDIGEEIFQETGPPGGVRVGPSSSTLYPVAPQECFNWSSANRSILASSDLR